MGGCRIQGRGWGLWVCSALGQGTWLSGRWVSSALEVAQDGLGEGLLEGLQLLDVGLQGVLAVLVLVELRPGLAAGGEGHGQAGVGAQGSAVQCAAIGAARSCTHAPSRRHGTGTGRWGWGGDSQLVLDEGAAAVGVGGRDILGFGAAGEGGSRARQAQLMVTQIINRFSKRLAGIWR